ncbi:MAG: TonB-dependent receptor domain-containing protein [Bryobacteraceae bacterium]
MRIFRLSSVLVIAAQLAAADMTGRVTDPSGAAIPGARIVLLRADTTVAAATESGADGRFRLADVAAGSYSVNTSGAAFATLRTPIQLTAGQNLDLPLRLTLQAVNAEITVTAETNGVLTTADVPQRVNVITREEINSRQRTSLVDLLVEEPGVDVQRTVPSMGGTSVRGLVGKNVAVYRDGIRYTTAAQRGGVSTFFNLQDSANLDSLEVLRGPNSAQYGSDSMGGTLNLISRSPADGLTGLHGEFSPFYTSAAHAFGGNLLTTFSRGRLAWTANLISRRVNTLRTAGGLDSHAAVTRFLGLGSTVLHDRLQDTAFTQYGGMFRAQFTLNPRHQLLTHYERSQQDGTKRADQLLGGDGNRIADIRNIMLDFGYLRWSAARIGPFDQTSATLSYNAQREERVNQGGNGNRRGAITHQYERTQVWGASFFAARHMQRHDLLIGGDGYRERMAAPAFTFSPASGSTVNSRPRVPDGARYLTYGLYLQDSWDALGNGRLRLSGALRFGGASYNSRASASRLWPDDSLAVNNVTGRLGAVVRIAAPLRVHAHYSRGFRAPSVTDLGAVGLQGNGAYEAAFIDLSGRAAMLGDRADDRAVSTGAPVARVRAERSDNYDLGFQFTSTRLRFELTGFRMNLRDAIVSQTLLLPAGAVGQIIGDQIITRQLPSGAVFVPLSSGPVLTRGNLGNAQMYGLEHRAEWKLSLSWLLAENATYLYARDAQTGLPPDIEGGTPPLTANLRLRYNPAAKRYWAETYSTLAGRQNRLSSLALADRRTGATRSRANIASFFANGAVGQGLVAGGILLPTGETLTQVQNRVLGAANSAPMFTAVPGYALFGTRAGWRATERSDVFVDISNMLDQRHRGVSWGADGAGRSLTLRYLYRF